MQKMDQNPGIVTTSSMAACPFFVYLIFMSDPIPEDHSSNLRWQRLPTIINIALSKLVSPIPP